MSVYAYASSAMERGRAAVRSREIRRVTEKRQITIPKEMAERIGLGRVVELELLDDAGIIVRPVKSETFDFSAEILADLVREGVSGDDLVEAFRERKLELAHAIDQLNNEVDQEVRSNPEDGRKFIRSLLDDGQ